VIVDSSSYRCSTLRENNPDASAWEVENRAKSVIFDRLNRHAPLDDEECAESTSAIFSCRYDAWDATVMKVEQNCHDITAPAVN